MANNGNPNYTKRNVQPFQIVQNHVQLIQRNAISCTWEQAMKCPCVDIQTGQPKPNCPVCHGQGFIYYNAVDVDISLYSDEKKLAVTESGTTSLMGTEATPQITVNGVEQGMKVGDRITVNGWDTVENYVFNVTKSRLNNKMFLPYKVDKIIDAYVISNNVLTKLDVNTSFSLEDNLLEIKDDSLLNATVSLNLSVIKRFYIVYMEKELRYLQVSKNSDKLWATGRGNNYLTYDQVKEGKFPNGVQVFRMSPKLLLRRETLYFSNTNLISSETDNNMIINDPNVSAMNDFLGSE